jgi:hypothetical protein
MRSITVFELDLNFVAVHKADKTLGHIRTHEVKHAARP